MPLIGSTLNHKKSEEFCFAIGKVLLNFSAIELWTFNVYEEVLGGRAYKKLRGLSFSQRCDAIMKDCKRSISQGNFDTLAEVIDESKQLAKFRNKIAHNPVVLAWKKGKPAHGEPDILKFVRPKRRKAR